MCVLCKTWSDTPFAARPTTDVPSGDAHSLLLLGFWVGVMNMKAVVEKGMNVPELCAVHTEQLDAITEATERRIAQIAALEALAPSPEDAAKVEQLRARIGQLGSVPGQALPVPTTVVQSEVQSGPPSYQCPFCPATVVLGSVHACTTDADSPGA